ncbi:gag-pol polyprotein [Tanacetum coccineum]
MIPMSMTPMQINMKFMNHLQPEWSRFVTIAKQARDLHSVNFDQLYAFLKHNERDAKEVQEMRQRFPEPLALLANTYNPPPSYNSRQSQGYAGNAGNNQASGARVINTVGNARANQPRVIICYNCNGKGHIAKQCTTRKKVKDSRWFKEKMLIAQAQEAGVVLNKEQHDFLADSLEETDDYCDDEATTNAIFLENLSPVGPINDDTIETCYDSNIHSKVPHYDTYHDYDMLNSNILELGYIENIVSYNESYDELTGNNNVISYTHYMLTIGNNKDNYVPPPVQKNDMMLSIIEQMKSQVENYNMVNQESKSVNESLTSELEQYKDRVRVLEYAVKDGHSEQEAYLSHELYTAISDRNRKVIDFKKQVFSQKTQMKDLNNHITFLKKSFETLKQESSEKYEKNISEIVELEKAKKKLENIVFKVGAFKKDVIPYSENLKETFKLFEKGFIVEVKEMKDIFEQMEDEVDQCSVAKKSFEIEKKQLLINNDRLLEENIASDIMCTYLRSLNEVDNCGKCKSLDIVLLDLQESNKSLCELRKHFAKLEEYNITLDIAFQNHKEQMILNDPETKNKQFLVKTINNQYVKINDLKKSTNAKDIISQCLLSNDS